MAAFGKRRTRGEVRRRFLAVAATSAALVVFAPACSGGGDDKPSAPKPSASSTTTRDLPAPSAELTLKPGVQTVESAGAEMTLDSGVVRQVTKVANAYVKTGILDPLVTGRAGEDFESLFGISVLADVQAEQPDRAVLTEEATPRATGVAKSRGAKFDLVGLADQAGTLVMVTGRMAFRISVPTADGSILINRIGDLVFEPTTNGEWLISGYSIVTSRENERTDRARTTSAESTTPSSSGGNP